MQDMIDEAKAELSKRNRPKKPNKKTEPLSTVEPEKKVFSQSTQELIESFDSHMYALWRLSDVESYKMSYTDEDKEDKHIIKIVNSACSLLIDQEDGKATKLQVVSRDITDDTNMNNIIAGFLAAMYATNFEYFGGEATYEDALNVIMADDQPHTIGEAVYTYTDTRPVFKVISLTVEPAS